MAYTIVENQSGLLQIATIDTGVTSPSGVSTGTTSVIPTPPNVLGKIVRADDPTYGEGELSCWLALLQRWSVRWFRIIQRPTKRYLFRILVIRLAP